MSGNEPATHYTGYAPGVENPTRIAPLAVLPVFFKLAGKRVVLAGGSPGAAWKAELLAASGAFVEIYAIEPCTEMLEIVTEHPKQIRLLARPWSYEVLQGAALAIGAIEEEAEGQAFRCAAKHAGVPVNVVDRPRFCDFSFGAIVNRSPLIIGISTDGAAPVLGQAVRARIDALLPVAFQRWAEAARDWRAAVKASGLSFAARRNFWRIFTNFAVKNPQIVPQLEKRDVWLCEAASAEESAAGHGSVVFVGIGNGEAELLTMKAVRMLQTADVIIAKPDISADILDLARREARKILPLEGVDWADHWLPLAQQGSRVICLLPGSAKKPPGMKLARKSHLPVEIVPGIG